MNNIKYHYYQGFHDLGLFISLMYDGKSEGIMLLQRISEFYLKDYMRDKDGDEIFLKISSILKYIMEKNNSEIYNYIFEIIGDLPPVYYSLILCLFTHTVDDIFVSYRILDYLLVSHPIAIYHLCANVII